MRDPLLGNEGPGARMAGQTRITRQRLREIRRRMERRGHAASPDSWRHQRRGRADSRDSWPRGATWARGFARFAAAWSDRRSARPRDSVAHVRDGPAHSGEARANGPRVGRALAETRGASTRFGGALGEWARASRRVGRVFGNIRMRIQESRSRIREYTDAHRRESIAHSADSVEQERRGLAHREERACACARFGRTMGPVGRRLREMRCRPRDARQWPSPLRARTTPAHRPVESMRARAWAEGRRRRGLARPHRATRPRVALLRALGRALGPPSRAIAEGRRCMQSAWIDETGPSWQARGRTAAGERTRWPFPLRHAAPSRTAWSARGRPRYGQSAVNGPASPASPPPGLKPG
jgi:hypothetical protein